MSIGFVFKVDGNIFLTKYLGDGEFTDGIPITNVEPYEELGENQLAISEVKEVHRGNGDVAFMIKDHYFITVSHDEEEDVRGCDVLSDLDVREALSEVIERVAEQENIDI